MYVCNIINSYLLHHHGLIHLHSIQHYDFVLWKCSLRKQTTTKYLCWSKFCVYNGMGSIMCSFYQVCSNSVNISWVWWGFSNEMLKINLNFYIMLEMLIVLSLSTLYTFWSDPTWSLPVTNFFLICEQWHILWSPLHQPSKKRFIE